MLNESEIAAALAEMEAERAAYWGLSESERKAKNAPIRERLRAEREAQRKQDRADLEKVRRHRRYQDLSPAGQDEMDRRRVARLDEEFERWQAKRLVELPRALAQLEALDQNYESDADEDAYDRRHQGWFEKYREHFDSLCTSFRSLKIRKFAIFAMQDLARRGWASKYVFQTNEGEEKMGVVQFPGAPMPGPCKDYEEPAAEPLRVISAASFAGKKAPERDWMVSTVIPAKIVGGIYGDGGSGKSLLALMLAVAAVTGRPWLGYAVKRGPVVYLCCEDDEEEVWRRLEDICRGMGVDMAALGDLHIVALADEDSVLANAAGGSSVLSTTKRYDQVAELVKRVRPVLVIGDTLTDIYAASENDRMLAKQFVKAMRKLVVPFGGTFLLLAHPSLDGLRSGRGSSGTTGWNNSVRWRAYLDKVLEEDGTEPDRTKRVLHLMKANYGPQGGQIRLQWRDGCYLLDGASAGGGDPLVEKLRVDGIFIDLLSAYESEGRVVSASPSSTYAPAVFAKDPRVQGLRKKQLTESMNRLFAAGKIHVGPVAPGARGHSRSGLVVKRKPA